MQDYDYLIVGAGSAAWSLPGRLPDGGNSALCWSVMDQVIAAALEAARLEFQ